MVKTLLKKQLLESVGGFLNSKDGKRRDKKTIFGFALLMVFVLGSFGFVFYGLGSELSAPLAAQGLTWVYFAFMSTIAMAFGIIGMMFTAKARLYEAKDNDLLLSMPIPPILILFSRMLGLYLFTLFFEGLVFLPAVIAFFVEVIFSLKVLVFSLFVWLIMAFGTLALCVLLGWLLAVIAAKFHIQKLLTMLFAVAFMVLYFVVYSKLNELFTYVLTHGGAIGAAMKKWLYPFWKMGVACAGGWGELLIVAAIFVGTFALVYLLLSKTYLRLATANRGGKKAKYVSKEGKQTSTFWALVKKELKRYTDNPMVALNCMLGTIFLIILPFVLLFAKDIREPLGALNEDGLLALLLAAALCVASSMNMVSAASVSLEGENLWIVRSMPVPTRTVLFAKVGFHALTVALPATFSLFFMGILLQIGIGYLLLAFITVLSFIAVTALLGLLINLKMPNLHWTNELVAVKQSGAAVLSMFAEFGLTILLVGGYFLFGKYLTAGGYLLFCTALLLTVSGLIGWWLEKRGVERFEEL